MRRLVTLAALLAFVSCARGTEVRLLEPSDLPRDVYSEQREPDTANRMVFASVFYVRTEPQEDPSRPAQLVEPVRLGVVDRQLETTWSEPEAAVRLLLAGPTADERRAGYATVIESGTELLSISVEDGVADVNVSAEFETVTSQLGHLMRIAQVVWTLTDLPDIDSVSFRIHGVEQPAMDQDGVPHDKVGRDRYSQFAPRDVGEPAISPGAIVPDGP